MGTQATHDLAVKTGEYQDRNGETKARWLRIGTVFRHDDGGTSIKLDCLPVGLPDWSGWVNVFKRDDQAQQQPRAQQQPARNNGNGRAHHAPPSSADFDDDIPF